MTGTLSPCPRNIKNVSESFIAVQAEDQPSWAEIVRHAEHGESVSVIAHGDHVAEIVPSGELDRLRETIEVLSDSDLVRDLREGLADARDGRVFSADQIAAGHVHRWGRWDSNPHWQDPKSCASAIGLRPRAARTGG